MKTFEEPKIEIVSFAVEDIVTTSEPNLPLINDCLS